MLVMERSHGELLTQCVVLLKGLGGILLYMFAD
jgi:hypothetical protein